MADSTAVAQVVLLSAGITWALRAAPFAALAPLRDSTTVRYLSVHMPLGVMVMLVLYSLRGVTLAHGPSAGASAAAVAVTLGLHLRWRRPLLSILGGSAVRRARHRARRVTLPHRAGETGLSRRTPPAG